MTEEKGATSAIIAETGKKSGELKDIHIPAEYIEKINSPFVLLLYENKNRVMKVLPIAKDDVYFLKITINTMGHEFLTKLNITFNDSGLTEMIFTTGVCMKEDTCFYECYFNEFILTITIDELRDKLEKLTTVREVLLTKVGPTGIDDEPEEGSKNGNEKWWEK